MLPINDPDVVAEITALHEEYEAALVGNDVRQLMHFFWDSPLALRFGVRESLYGSSEIEAFRKARSPIGLEREVFNLRITVFGDDTGTVTLEFTRMVDGGPRHGRQTQVWRRFPDGWKIVLAHVSFAHQSYVDLAAALIGLPIPPEHRDAVSENVERAAQIAASLLRYPLAFQHESAPRFEP